MSWKDDLQAFEMLLPFASIAHGADTGNTLSVVRQYFDQMSRVFFQLSNLFGPTGNRMQARSQARADRR